MSYKVSEQHIFRTPGKQKRSDHEKTSPTVLDCTTALCPGSHQARSRKTQGTRIRHRELPHRRWRDLPASARGLRNLRPFECGERQCRTTAVALHGGLSRLRMADWSGQSARPGETFSRSHGTVRERAFLFAEQYARAVPRPAISSHDYSRQRGSRAPLADRGTENHA